MISASIPVRTILAAGILSLTLASAAHARTFAQTIISHGDEATGTGPLQEEESPGYDPSSVMDDLSVEFDLGPAGANGFLAYSGTASAWARIEPLGQYLGTAATGTLTNSFYDEDFNYDNGTGFVPTVYGAQSIASFTETLRYGGTATNYTSKYYFHLSGINVGVGTSTFIQLTHGTAPTQSFFFDQPGVYDQIITSISFVHGLFPQEITLRMTTQVNFYTEFMDEGSSASGESNFGSTLELLGIELRDENGILAPDGTIMSDSGSHYAVVAPEPTVSLLLGLAAVGLGCRRRRCGETSKI